MQKLIIFLSLFTIHYSLFTSAHAGGPPQRIISLAPNLTEVLFTLGLGDKIVGVTSFCDYPEEAKKKTKVGGMSNPSLEAVISLKPDIVVMTTDGNPKEFEERLRRLKIKTHVFRARRLSELPQGIRETGSALGVEERAERLAKDIEASINKAGSQKSEVKTQKKKVLFIVWPEPLIVAGPGTLAGDAIIIAGQGNIAEGALTPYPKYSIEEVIRQGPDIIVIGKGHGIKEASEKLLKRFRSVPAVKNSRVYYMSDSLYRLSPRIIRGLEELTAIFKADSQR